MMLSGIKKIEFLLNMMLSGFYFGNKIEIVLQRLCNHFDRQVSHIGFMEGWPIHDCSAEVSCKFSGLGFSFTTFCTESLSILSDACLLIVGASWLS